MISSFWGFFCNRGDDVQYHGGLRSRELCQAPMVLVFLTPRQDLAGVIISPARLYYGFCGSP